jgi:16S rRNA G966 N2-methylase RsmD
MEINKMQFITSSLRAITVRVKRYYRYLWYIFRAFVLEAPRGLDFHRRDKSIMDDKNNGYALTPESHLKKIFKILNISNENSFIDIGCGKGFVLTKAAKYQFGKIAGIEINPRLAQIARKNISVLKLRDRIDVLSTDATLYQDYDNYDHFFFFDPFAAEIFRLVVNNILESLNKRSRKLTVIYSRPTSHHIFMETGRFEVIKKIHCSMKDWDTYIYKNI